MTQKFMQLLMHLATTALLLMPIEATSQQVDPELRDFAAKLPEDVRRRVSSNPSGALRQIMQQFFEMAPNGILTSDAVDLYGKRARAQQRNRTLLTFISYDLDGDGAVSADEIHLQETHLAPQLKADLATKLGLYDKNNDRALDRNEIRAAVAQSIENSPRQSMRLIDLMVFDFDKDGQVTSDEVTKLVNVLDQVPLPQRSNPSIATDTRPTALCNAPKPSDNVETVFLSGRSGRSLTTVTLAGQDTVTSSVDIRISDGETPLYIFAQAFAPQIWRFKGATDRIERLVLVATSPDGSGRAGVTGLDPNVTTFVTYGTCFGSAVTKRDNKSDAQIAMLAEWLGRDFNHIQVSYYMSGYQVPPGIDSAVVELLKRPYDSPVEFTLADHTYALSNDGISRDGGPFLPAVDDKSGMGPLRSMMHFNPAGLVPFSPEEVHAPVPAQPYVVLPQEAGLLQLIADGGLIYEGNGRYMITRSMTRFPAGLNGSHSVQFNLPNEIDMPAGDPGHSKIYVKETGQCLTEQTCGDK